MGIVKEMVDQLSKEYGKNVTEVAGILCQVTELGRAALAASEPNQRPGLALAIMSFQEHLTRRELSSGFITVEDLPNLNAAITRLSYSVDVEVSDARTN